MEAMRQSWTDDRLDDLKARMEESFRHVDLRFEQIDQRFELVDHRFDRVEHDLRALRVQLSAFQRMFLQLNGGMIVTFVVGFAGLIATRL